MYTSFKTIILVYFLTNTLHGGTEINGEYEIVFLEDLNANSISYKTSPNEHGSVDRRGIFIENGLVYKVWNEDYSRSKTFLAAVNAGYFNTVSKIKYIIFDHNNNCRGYVIPPGKIVNLPSLTSKGEASYTMNNRQCYSLWHIKNDKFTKLLRNLISLLDSHGYIFIDFTPPNLIELDGNYYIIDLDAVFSRKEVVELYQKKRYQFDFYMSCIPYIYKDKVINYIVSAHSKS